MDEDQEQLRISSVKTLEPFKRLHGEGTRIDTCWLDIKSKMTLPKLESWAPKEDGIRIAEGRYPGPVSLVIWARWPNPEGYKKRRSWFSGTYLRTALDMSGSDVDRNVFVGDLLVSFLAWRRALLI